MRGSPGSLPGSQPPPAWTRPAAPLLCLAAAAPWLRLPLETAFGGRLALEGWVGLLERDSPYLLDDELGDGHFWAKHEGRRAEVDDLQRQSTFKVRMDRRRREVNKDAASGDAALALNPGGQTGSGFAIAGVIDRQAYVLERDAEDELKLFQRESGGRDGPLLRVS